MFSKKTGINYFNQYITFDRTTLSNNYGSALDSISEDVSSQQNFMETYIIKQKQKDVQIEHLFVLKTILSNIDFN